MTAIVPDPSCCDSSLRHEAGTGDCVAVAASPAASTRLAHTQRSSRGGGSGSSGSGGGSGSSGCGVSQPSCRVAHHCAVLCSVVPGLSVKLPIERRICP